MNPDLLRKLIPIAVIAVFVMAFLGMTTKSVFVTIEPGEKGVKFKRFAGGLDKDKIYGQGFHVVAPWNKMIVYDIKENESYETMAVLSKNGLSIAVELTYRYSPIPDKIGYLHDEIGVNYVDRIIKPEIRSATREVIGKYLPEELYSSKREAIQDEIEVQTKIAAEKKHLEIDAVLIRSVELPPSLKAAIEQKLEEEQLAFQFEFRLDKERLEAERRIIEATAKAEANRILSASLTDRILQDKGIDATLELGKSPNSKIVIVGSGENGLPLILGN